VRILTENTYRKWMVVIAVVTVVLTAIRLWLDH